MDACLKALDESVRVAMVFEKNIPNEYLGFPVIDGDKYDMRYLDEGAVIVGLKYKKTRNKLTQDNSFVIQH